MKSINIVLVLSLLSITNTMHSSNYNAQLAEDFLENPIANQFNFSQLQSLYHYTQSHSDAFYNPSGAVALYKTAQKDNYALEIDLLKKGGADKASNERGLTAANEATCDRHITLKNLKTLIANNIDFNQLNRHGQTAIEFAVITNNLLGVTLLAQSAARGSDGNMPIELAHQKHENIKREYAQHPKMIEMHQSTTQEIIKILNAKKN